jgi:MarR family transcriptional regulator, organic hydroperoxide resistance regulator
MTRKPVPGDGGTQAILRHWREAVPNDRLAHLVRDAAKGLTRALQARLAEEGVSFGHWVFLRILWETDGLTQSELSEEAGVMEPTTFAALKAMERLGYIKRRKTPENRKKVFIHLTADGRSLKARLVPLAVDVNRVAVNGAAAGDIAATRALLLRMIENLAADEGHTEGRPKSRKPSRRKRTGG